MTTQIIEEDIMGRTGNVDGVEVAVEEEAWIVDISNTNSESRLRVRPLNPLPMLPSL